MSRGETGTLLPTGVTLSLVALGLTLIPQGIADAVRATVRDAALPGLRYLTLTREQLDAARRSLSSTGETAERLAALGAELDQWQLRCRRMTIQNALLHEELQRAKRDGVSPYDATPAKPLVVPGLLEASVLGEETARLWRTGRLIDRGAVDGVGESSLVLDDTRPLVDQGADSGLATGQPVYSGRSVLGKIAVVGRWTSTVQPVTDPGFRGMAQLARRTEGGVTFGPTAILEGCGERLCRLKLVPATEPVSIGDEVYSAPRDATLPFPLYYGKVVRAEIKPGAPHWEIDVDPAANRIEPQTVQILTRQLNPLRQQAQ